MGCIHPPSREHRPCSLQLLLSCHAGSSAHHCRASTAPGGHCQPPRPPPTAPRMPLLTANSPSHIEAEAQVKYCVADPCKARTRWKPPGRHRQDPALLVPPPSAKPRGKGPGAQHSTKEGHWGHWLRQAELGGQGVPSKPCPWDPNTSTSAQTAWACDTVRRHPSLAQKMIMVVVTPVFYSLALQSYRVSRAIPSPVPQSPAWLSKGSALLESHSSRGAAGSSSLPQEGHEEPGCALTDRPSCVCAASQVPSSTGSSSFPPTPPFQGCGFKTRLLSSAFPPG